MEERNLDLEIPLREAQWEQIGRRAASMGREVAGVEWAADTDRIHVYMTDEEARGLWRDQVSDESVYGESEMEVAQFVYNDGRPYARLEPPSTAKPPAILPQDEAAMQAGLERFVREKWDTLLKESGVHYERGHVSPEVQ